MGSLSWTAEQDQELRQLATDGWSARQISVRFPGKTRNAVIGRLHRIGAVLTLKNRYGQTIDPKAKAQRDLENQQRRAAVRLAKGISFQKKEYREINHIIDGNPTPKCISFMELDNQSCRYVIGDVKGLDTVFCGDIKLDGQAYCQAHYRWCYRPSIYKPIAMR